MTPTGDGYTRAARLEEIEPEGCKVVQLGDLTLALFRHEGKVFAVDNRCPHMGFPLNQGSVQCGILTCDWHHARFDMASGGTFHLWADDVRTYPTRIENGDIWVDLAPPIASPVERYHARLAHGLKHNLRLVLAKAVIGLDAAGESSSAALSIAAEFGARYARNGWGSGMTILTAMANILPHLAPADRPRALYQGLMHVANQTAGQPPVFPIDPLPTTETRPHVFKQWFRDFIEVRNSDGAQRTLQTAIAVGVPMPDVAEMLFAACTDHVYLGGGHPLDFTNKAFELLDLVGWERAGDVLPSLVAPIINGSRSEEQSNWRHPVDLAELLWAAYEELPTLVAQGKERAGAWSGRDALIATLLQENPAATVAALKSALASGADFVELASAVAFAALRRIAHFRTSNEFGDWITVLHTFTYANAIHQALRRAPSMELLRGVFDAAMSVYLDRFLNKPPAPLPALNGDALPADLLPALLDVMNTQQQVTESAKLVLAHLASGNSDADLLATLGEALLREDAEFHTFQMVEAGFRQYADLRESEDGNIALIAIVRYLAAHSPTARATGQTYATALRLHRGENIYAE